MYLGKDRFLSGEKMGSAIEKVKTWDKVFTLVFTLKVSSLPSTPLRASRAG